MTDIFVPYKPKDLQGKCYFFFSSACLLTVLDNLHFAYKSTLKNSTSSLHLSVDSLDKSYKKLSKRLDSACKSSPYLLDPEMQRICCCCSAAQWRLTLCDPTDCEASLSFTTFQSLLKLMSIESVMPSNHLILCRPLLLLPSIFPSIRVFSNESALCIRWPKYWSLSFSISSSNEHPGLISLRMDWLVIALNAPMAPLTLSITHGVIMPFSP